MSLELRARARKLRNRWVNLELQRLEAVRRQLQRGEVDVLALGDSSFTTPSPRDTDLRMIPELISERLDGARVATVAGPGFSGFLFGEMLRVLGTLDQRPKAVVFSCPIRTNTMVHIRHHPRYSYPTTHQALAATRSARHRIRAIGRGYDPTPEDYAAFGRLPVRSRWSGETTIDGFRNQLKGMGKPPWPDETERVLFDYFHGEVIEPDDKDLPQLTEFGTRLNEYGVPAVAYWTLPPLERGERHYPGEFTDHVRANWELVRKTLTAEAEGLTVVESDLVDEDFEDSQNATEHYSFTGRSKIADDVTAVVRQTWR
ncbi:hypothetical protein [Nocardioides antri]|uniref:SGNH/GDSL hydrolase family protein n=1 Tax=Nocardioides antri TaxID=2607659 RepID=A0A5B1M4V1_9ACTN|nr:hypothetical protein [Nocardioides antri]KAA1427478.1 hypothetical protein F0U47_08395 [Nocardioides antri]